MTQNFLLQIIGQENFLYLYTKTGHAKPVPEYLRLGVLTQSKKEY